eukprot:2477889-Pleurochrysis_carterae.AAC.1
MSITLRPDSGVRGEGGKDLLGVGRMTGRWGDGEWSEESSRREEESGSVEVAVERKRTGVWK